jgi:acyl-CoA synthetase (AMP-forming)/AMP-acid ligase II
MPEEPRLDTMPAVLRRAAALYGEDDFIVMPDRRTSFRELEYASRQLALQLLAAGTSKGTRVGIHLATGPEWAVAFAAVTRIGAVAMPFSTLYRPPELRTAMRLGDIALLISAPTMLGKDNEAFLEDALAGLAVATAGRLRVLDAPFLRTIVLIGDGTRSWAQTARLTSTPGLPAGIDDPLLEAVEAEVSPADWLLVMFTAGTTAEPKAIIHSQGAAMRKTSPGADAALHAIFPGRVLMLMPFFWIGGIQEVLSALQTGATLLTLERLDATAALELGRRERATSVMGNSKALQTLFGDADLARLIPSVRPLPSRPWEGPASSKSDPPTALGMSETFGPWAAVRGFEYRVVDPESGKVLREGQEGEFEVRGYGLMQGIYKQERETTFEPDGYFRTGDRGYLENGLVYFNGRLKDVIKTKGANVAPAEVEAVLNAHPGVRISFVFGLPHERYGQEVVAAVVRDDEAQIDTDLLRGDCRRDLSSYKVPTTIVVLEPGEVPHLPSSKPDRRAIRDLVAAHRNGQGCEHG